MKKSHSIHLEEDLWKEIDDYKAKYNLSSRNVAIERMMIERRMLFMMINSTELKDIQHPSMNVEYKTTNENDKKIKDSRINKSVLSSIEDSFNSMPE